MTERGERLETIRRYRGPIFEGKILGRGEIKLLIADDDVQVFTFYPLARNPPPSFQSKRHNITLSLYIRFGVTNNNNMFRFSHLLTVWAIFFTKIHSPNRQSTNPQCTHLILL